MSEVIDLLDSPDEIVPPAARKRKRTSSPEVIDLLDSSDDQKDEYESSDEESYGSDVQKTSAALAFASRMASATRIARRRSTHTTLRNPSVASSRRTNAEEMPEKRSNSTASLRRSPRKIDQGDGQNNNPHRVDSKTTSKRARDKSPESSEIEERSPSAIASKRRRLKDPPEDVASQFKGDPRPATPAANRHAAAATATRFKDPPAPNEAAAARRKNSPEASAAVAAAAAAATVYTVDDDDDDDDFVETLVSPEQQILEIFPDVAQNHVTTLLEQYDGNHEQVVAHLVDNPNYPKSKSSSSAIAPNIAARGVVSIHREVTRRTWTHDFSSVSSFAPTRVYTEEATSSLYRTFPWLSKKGALALLKKYSHYAVAHEKVVMALKGNGEEVEQLNRFQAAMSSTRLSQACQDELQKLLPAGSVALVIRTNARNGGVEDSATKVSDPILREELEYVDQKLQDWVNAADQKRERERKKDKVQLLGTGIECACCFDEFDIDDMVSCKREGHLFCVDCLQRFASTKIFGEGNLGIDKNSKEPSLDLICFHPDGCNSPFERNILVKALTKDTLQKYDEIQAQLTISKAGLSDLVTCPKCGFQAALAASQKVFECPCDDCRFASCRDCGEAAHLPLRCEEVTKDAIETKGRLTVEEAITAAKIRNCPKCKKPFIKSDGCNKIRCGCGTLVCYLCSQQISGYEHFCQTPLCQHESCNKCQLHSNTEQDDELAMKKAGLQAASEIKSQLAGITTKEVNIDVDSILKKPNATATRNTQRGLPNPRQMPPAVYAQRPNGQQMQLLGYAHPQNVQHMQPPPFAQPQNGQQMHPAYAQLPNGPYNQIAQQMEQLRQRMLQQAYVPGFARAPAIPAVQPQVQFREPPPANLHGHDRRPPHNRAP